MYEEPSDDNDERSAEAAADPLTRAREKTDEFRMHAELAAVLEAARKFDAEIRSDFDGNLAREIQRTIGKLEKSRSTDHPILLPPHLDDAANVLKLPIEKQLSTNDYHVHRRPGEVMILRFLAGEEVEKFYERMQAHFDAALEAYRQEERQSNEWKQDPATLAYLDALDKIEIKMADRYLRDTIKQHRLFVLSTQAADEIDILHLTDYLMGVEAAKLIGPANAPPEDGATERERAWFFKLFSLRGIIGGEERMCFFTYLQKADEGW